MRNMESTNDPWSPVDPLGEALYFLRMSGVFYTRSEFTAPFALALPPMPDCLMFHAVTSGECWLESDGKEPPQRLRPGDFVLVPHGEGHRLSSAPGFPAVGLFDIPREQVSERYEILRLGGGGAGTNVICGAVRFDHPAAHHLVRLLPPTIRIDTWRAPEADWFQSTLRLMAAEASALRPGGETVITRLADILVIQGIRAWITQEGATRPGWLGALRDPQIGRALTLIHRDPEREWTVASLAGEVAMSRSAFAARFTELVSEPPMQYVRRWRMYLAQASLRDDDPPLAELANRLGYQSEAAFSRAFKRVTGLSPGAARRSTTTYPLP